MIIDRLIWLFYKFGYKCDYINEFWKVKLDENLFGDVSVYGLEEILAA